MFLLWLDDLLMDRPVPNLVCLVETALTCSLPPRPCERKFCASKANDLSCIATRVKGELNSKSLRRKSEFLQAFRTRHRIKS